MPSRQDQLHSYQFMVQRVVSAMVVRETDPAQSPFRRVAVAALASLLVAMVGVAGFAVYGVFVGGGGTGWQSSANAVIVEKESGASFVYRDGLLHPVRNIASALLIAGGSAPDVISVSRASLAGTPRGALLGIADAPAVVPTPVQLVGGAWTVCALGVRGEDSTVEQVSLLAVGERHGVLAGGTALTDAEGTLVTPDRNAARLYLLWRNRKYEVRTSADDTVAIRALSMSSYPPRLVDQAFLNAIDNGDAIKSPRLDPDGASSFGTAQVGDLFKVVSAAGDPQYFVAQADGLAEISPLQANLLGNDDHVMRELSPAQLPKRTGSLIPTGENAPPRSAPKFVDTGSGGLCAVVADDTGVRGMRYGVPAPPLSGLVRTAGQRTQTRAVIADYVLVEPGRGALVEGFTAPGTSGGVVSLVTDLGQQFAIGGDEARAALGFAGVTPVHMPIGLVALLPQGPRLDRADAGQAITLS